MSTEAHRRAALKYYHKKKNDPDFKKRRSEKDRLRYQRRKEKTPA